MTAMVARTRDLLAIRKQGRSGWGYARTNQVAKGSEEVIAQLRVDDAAPGANYGLAVAPDIPGDPQARREVLVIAVIQRGELLAELHQSQSWIEAAQQAIGLLERGVELVA